MELNIDLNINENVDLNINEDEVKKYVTRVLEKEYISNSKKVVYLSLLFTNNDEIQDINKKYRKKDAPTDVISFAYHEVDEGGFFDTLGDIIISIERVEDQAKNYNHSFERELYYVLTHGILHLLGYDHLNESDKKEMRKKEEEILNINGYRRE